MSNLNLEEKILDGPRVHYVDNEDNDIRHEQDCGDNTDLSQQSNFSAPLISPSITSDRQPPKLSKIGRSETINGCSVNTGPKGVIQDFKQHVTQKNRHPQSAISEDDLLELEFKHLREDDTILEEFKQKMMLERSLKNPNPPEFGSAIHVKSGDEFLKNVDNENPNVLVLCHVYRRFSQTCLVLNKHLEELAREYKHIKFIYIDASVVGLSNNFIENGVPALLAYKNGNLVKSLVSLEEIFGRNFELDQVKELLAENDLNL